MSENIKLTVTLEVRVDGDSIDAYLKRHVTPITDGSRHGLAEDAVKDVFKDMWEFATGLPGYNSRDLSPSVTVEEILSCKTRP